MTNKEQKNVIIADETAKAPGTYYYYFAPDTYRQFGWQLVLPLGATVTVTLEGTMFPDKDTSYYDDITNDIWGVASITASEQIKDSDSELTGYSWVRLKVVTTTPAGDDYKIAYKAA